MKLINTLILALVVSSASAATGSTESDMWINNKTWELAFNAGDTDALTRLYSEDAIVVPPSLEILNAPEKIKDYWINQILSGTDNFRVQTINLKVQGDVIYQTAVWIATVTSNGVATDLDGEMTNVIARQTDGSWKIQLQSWN
jgi:ketosteroid isomerase-like protein